MKDMLQYKAENYTREHKKRKLWQRVVSGLAAVAVFCTTYALILPAITWERSLVCEIPAHQHNESCYEVKTVPGEKELACLETEHIHGSECYIVTENLICGLEETEGHKHGSSCSVQTLICTEVEHEGHTHGEGCFNEAGELICTLDESEGHSHSESCYRTDYICGLEESEGHSHSEACYEKVLECQIPEHVHSEDCWAEGESHEERVLVCQLEEHEHSATCFDAPPAEDDGYYCGQIEHIHSEEQYCYFSDGSRWCTIPEHVHTLACKSNPNADVESESYWRSTFANVSLTGNWDEDVIAIAKTQIGYTESTQNYEVQEDGTTIKGYTRYGDWYGNKYGDWCAMFCSFCMNYAGVDREMMPFEASCQRWVEKLTEKDMFRESIYYKGAKDDTTEYQPKPGDLIFFDWDEAPDSDHVGFVCELIKDANDNVTEIKTIEGNNGDLVACHTYKITDSNIMGYGELPETPILIDGVIVEGRTIESAPASDGAIAVVTGKIPDGAVVEIEAVTLSDEQLIEYFGEEKAAFMSGYVAYDITILVNGEEWQPDGSVGVTIKQPDIQISKSQKLEVAHVNSTTSEVSVVNSELDENGDIKLTSDGFSLYIAYTVDFHYGEYSFSLAGEGSVLLSEIFRNLHIENNVADVVAAEFSEPDYVLVEKVNADWRLTSLQSFITSEELVLTFSDETILTILVTDPEITSLNDDLAYVSRFEITEIIDGIGPYDTNTNPDAADYSDRPGNDSSGSNGIVPSFDKIIYNMAYSTICYDEFQTISNGYLYYEFILPLSADKAKFSMSDMLWCGMEYTSLDDIPAGSNGYVLTQTDAEQILIGKKYLEPIAPNPSAIPGGGELFAEISVGSMKNGDQVQPEFRLWMDHNTTDGRCEEHDRDEVCTLAPDPVLVTSELRMNVQLKPVQETYCTGVDNFNFSTGGSACVDKDAGTVRGRINSYGITLQLYNDNRKGLRGCEIPEGDISVDVKMSVQYRTDANPNNLIPLTEEQYQPLVWRFTENDNVSFPNEREVGAYSSSRIYCALSVAPYNSVSNKRTYDLGTEGSSSCCDGGSWSIQKNGEHYRITNSDYYINPYYFPNTNCNYEVDSDIYYSHLNGVESTSTGCFSSCVLYVVTPFGEGEQYLATRYGNGTVQLTVEDIDLQAVGVSGAALPTATDNGNQMFTEDDRDVRTVYLSKSGSYTNAITYSDKNGTGLMYDTDGNYPNGNFNNGKDTAGLGQTITICWGCQVTPYGERSNAVYGINSLMKFDDEALEPDSGNSAIKPSSVLSQSTYTTHYFYAAKPDGKGWSSDAEMNAATEEDLIFFSTLEELKANDYTCVGILQESRSDNPSLSSQFLLQHGKFQVKQDSNLTGKVYQIVSSTRLMLEQDYLACDGQIPGRMDVQEGLYSEMPAASVNMQQAYVKSVYDEYSVYISGHNGGYSIGDSLYIVPYKTGIEKGIIQKDMSGRTMTTFDLDNNQRVADFWLQPSAKYCSDTITFTDTTTLTISDTLPKYLSYIPGSAYLGGSYQQADKLGRQGTVTGGTAIEPVAMKNPETGETTLTWIIENMPVTNTSGEALPTIIYSCQIGYIGTSDDVPNNSNLKNTVYITGTYDNRPPVLASGNYAECSISVSRLKSSSLSKFAREELVESGQPLQWELYYSNNATEDIVDALIMDSLPQNGDNHGSQFSVDALKVSEWTLDMTGITDISTWRAYYTTSLVASGTSAEDYTADDVRGGQSTVDGQTVEWTEVIIDSSTGTINVPDDEAITALVCIGTIKSGKVWHTSLTLDSLYSNQVTAPGDRFINQISYEDLSVLARTSVVGRSIEGVIWKDKDANGRRDTADSLMDDVKVVLYRFDTESGEYTPVSNGVVSSGKSINVLTGVTEDYSTGRYLFDGLSAGTYQVRFTSGTQDISGMKTTLINAAPDGINSKAIPTYSGVILSYATIDGIVLPSKESMASTKFESINNDAGFYTPCNITISKQVLGVATTESFPFEAAFVDAEGVPLNLSKITLPSGVTLKPNSTNVLCFSLENDTSISFDNLVPIGTKLTLVETNHNGYSVTMATNMGHSAGDNQSFTLYDDLSVTVTNIAGVILPSTGGIGVYPIYALGALLVTGSIVCGCILRRKRERRAEQ